MVAQYSPAAGEYFIFWRFAAADIVQRAELT